LEFGYQSVDVLATENPQAVSIYSDVSPASQSVPSGGPATVSILAKGWSPAFQWYKNGSRLLGATNRIYTVPTTTLADDGDRFFCVVSNNFNPANVVTSSVATVNVSIPNSSTWYPAVDGTTWDLATANWTTNGGTIQSLFAGGNNASFDSLGYNLGYTITVTNAVSADAVTFNVSGYQVYSLAGAGTLSGLNLLLTGDGSGGLVLDTSASFASATIAAGMLEVGDGSINGSFLANEITNNGTIFFNNTSGNLIIDGKLAGSGSIYQEGAGTTTLAATNNVYTIGSIDAGTLLIANAPIGNFANYGTLSFSSSINFLFTNAVSGSGAYLLAGYQTNIFTGVSSFTGKNSFLYTIAIVDNPAALGDPIYGSSDITGSLRLGGLYLSNNITWSQPLSFDSRVGAPSASAYAPHLDNFSGTNTLTSPLEFNNGGGTELNVESDSGLLAVESALQNNATGNANNLNLQGPGNGEWDGVITDGPGGAGVDSLNVLVRGSGFWALNGINTYSGNTTVSSGTLCGTGAINGPVTVATGAAIAPGYGGIGILTINNSLTLAAGSLTSVEINQTAATQDQIVGLTGVAYGGTLIVSNLSGTLTTNDSFPLFSSASYTGAFAGIRPATPGAGLMWNTNTLATDGTLRISSSAKPTPHITRVGVSGMTLTISGTNGLPGGQYVLLGSTNVALPLNQWTPLLTNSFDGSGNINLSTNIIKLALPQEFYILSQ
jgi:autotransporter-associated beta strand protein